jgi:cell division septum initiation protein DivIVA
VPGRFAELINRQLELFEQEDADFLARVEEAERAYDRADREEAEEVYGRFQELVEFGTETLAEMRDGYAATLDADAAEEYVDAFNDAVRRRLPRFALEIDEL